jgi:predicted nucleotide-binding protein (sugar kinase/HSP70/actin superfamily)
MTAEKKRVTLPIEPPEPPDPLELLEHIESAIEEAETAITQFDSRVRNVDVKVGGMDKKFAVPKISRPTKSVADIVRSQFKFACPVCESIAGKISEKLPSRTDQTKVYEAVYKLSSGDKKAENEAVQTLSSLGVLQEVMSEIKVSWEKLKEEERTK